MSNEKNRPEEGQVPVFQTAQLVWEDEVTGEVLEIEWIGAEPGAWDLAELGFAPRIGDPARADASPTRVEAYGPVKPGSGRYQCRIEITSGGG